VKVLKVKMIRKSMMEMKIQYRIKQTRECREKEIDVIILGIFR